MLLGLLLKITWWTALKSAMLKSPILICQKLLVREDFVPPFCLQFMFPAAQMGPLLSPAQGREVCCLFRWKFRREKYLSLHSNSAVQLSLSISGWSHQKNCTHHNLGCVLFLTSRAILSFFYSFPVFKGNECVMSHSSLLLTKEDSYCGSRQVFLKHA